MRYEKPEKKSGPRAFVSEISNEMTSLKFSPGELTEVALIFLVVFICLSMFLSIINDSFRRAREHINDDKQEIFSFMFNKLQCN
jgi:preprotein translocase subunit SecG